MFTTIAWTQSVDTNAVLTNHAAVPDPHVRVVGNDIIVPKGMNNILAMYALGNNLTRAQLNSPSLRRTLNPEVAPVDIAALPASPHVIYPYVDNPIPLDEQEALDFAAAEGGAGAQRQTGIVLLSDGKIAPDTRPFYTVRVTSATTAVAFGWTNCILTFDQALPAGTYDLIGARFRSTTLIAFRFVFVGGIWRPGFIGFTTANQLENPYSRGGGLGVWGTFSHNTPPTVDVLCSAADAAQAGEIDIVKTS